MTEVTINQITPRHNGGELMDVKLHFTYTIKIGDEQTSGSGSITIDNFSDLIDFDGLSSKVRQKLADNI